MRFMIFSLFFSDLIVFAAKCMLNRFTNASNLVAFCLFVFFFLFNFRSKQLNYFIGHSIVERSAMLAYDRTQCNTSN